MKSKDNEKKTGFQIPIFLGIASVWFGTHAGPGAASGKQTAIYFNEFGKWGLITPLIAMGVLGLCIYYAIEYSRIKGIDNFKDFTNSFFKPYDRAFSIFFEVTYLFTIIMALAGSIAAGAEIIYQYFNIPVIIGTMLLIAAAIILSIFGENLVRASSTIMTIFIVLCIGAISFTGLASPQADFAGNWAKTSFSDHNGFNAIVMAFVYAGFLASGNIANAISVSDGLASKKESKKAAITGVIMNTFLILAVALLLFAYPQYIEDLLPNYSVVDTLGYPILQLAYVAMVILAVTSTAVSYSFSTVGRYSQFIPIEAGVKRDFLTVAILFIATFLVSLLGLDVIIGKGYKLLGYAVIPTVIFPIMLLGNKKIKEAERE